MKILRVMLLAGLALALGAGAGWAASWDDCRHGERAVFSGQYEQGTRLYSSCLKSKKLSKRQRAVVYNNRGYAYYKLKDYARALRDYKTALVKYPSYALAHYNRGLLWGNQRKYKKAVAEFTSAIGLKPGYGQAYFQRGLIWLALKQRGRAEADLARAMALDPKYKSDFERLVRHLRNSGAPGHEVDRFQENVLRAAGTVK